MKKSANHYFAVFTIAMACIANTTSVFAETEFEAVSAALSLTKKISPDRKLQGLHARALDGSNIHFSAFSLVVQDKSLTYQYEVANLRTAPTATRANPKDQRLRFAVSHKNRLGDITVNKKLRVEYRFMDKAVGNNWRVRPSIGLSTQFTLGDHQFIPQTSFETYYNLKSESVDFHTFNASLAYRLTKNTIIAPGYLHIIQEDNRDSEFLTFSAQVSLD